LSHSIGLCRSQLEQIFLNGALNFLQDVLSRQLVESWASQAGHRWRSCLYSPLPTLLACIYKHMAHATSSRDVEDWVTARLPQDGACANSGDDFCVARRRLPEPVFSRALSHLGLFAQGNMSSRVWLVDGTGLTLPRSDANVAAFGKMHGKARLPGARLLLFTDADSGAVMNADIVGCDEGEMRQFLRRLPAVPKGTTIVGDRQFCSYLALCEIDRLGLGAVMRLNVSRKPVGVEPLGEGDEIQLWRRPPVGSSAFGEQIKELPEFCRVRVVRRRIERKGYRPVEIAVATNLLDAAPWPAERIIELYARRWRIENDIRDIKLRHGLTMLSCKSENTVRKEVWSALLAYNSIKVMQRRTGKSPREMSHERSRAMIVEMAATMAHALTTCLPMLHASLLQRLARASLRRQERPPCPRAIVRNTQADYPFLYRTRQQWYAHYLAA